VLNCLAPICPGRKAGLSRSIPPLGRIGRAAGLLRGERRDQPLHLLLGATVGPWFHDWPFANGGVFNKPIPLQKVRFRWFSPFEYFPLLDELSNGFRNPRPAAYKILLLFVIPAPRGPFVRFILEHFVKNIQGPRFPFGSDEGKRD